MSPRSSKLKGLVFGKLTVLGFNGLNRHKKSLWDCLCSCGKSYIAVGGNLKSGGTVSCGCITNRPFLKGQTFRRKGKGVSGFNLLFYQYKRSAKKRKYEFNLTEEEFRTLTTTICFYCGKDPSQLSFQNTKGFSDEGKLNSQFIYNGVDRVNNQLGYSIDNCVSCCRNCNKAKNILSVQEFLDVCKNVTDYQNKK